MWVELVGSRIIWRTFITIAKNMIIYPQNYGNVDIDS